MAEETVNTPLTPEKHVLEENCAVDFRSSINHRLSVGSHHFGSSPRRNSIVKSDSGQKTVPNYLRASIGSCHDFCKYGKKHTFEVLEEKPWKAIRKGTSSATSSPKNMDFVHIKVSGEPKKEKVVKTFSDAKTYSPRQNAPSNNKTRSMYDPKKNPSPEPLEIIKKVITSPSPKMDVLEKRGTSVGVKVSKNDEKTDRSLDKRSPIKSKLTKVKQSLSSDNSDGTRGKGERNGNFKTERKKDLAPSIARSSPKLRFTRTLSFEGKKTGTLKLASLMKDRNKTRMAGAKASKKEKVFEKTLHVHKVETGSLAETTPHEKDAKVKENYKNAPRSRVVSVKLQFRSGKVIELHSDNNAPRRLRFRRAEAAVGEDGKGEFTEKIFDNTRGNVDAAGAGLSSRDIVMKYQGVKGKKKAQALFNNVIEETASKLVESRKSKVKALVGAFETVISLQEVISSSQAARVSDE